ncbi:hypothetical protein KBX18_00630 [Corynebacterium sp. CCUG 69979]|uniref:hypothetical protein n=1 Tax=Corynebacterium sp. CCUG 69979 TaxID=2823890 RepID=UPI00210B62D8|nr:hypothetical protein [Corynebacterium sp. CCUG 69979]MCQ4624072.1 hypothetical protein [Corynebacterium sp. CCUG 69979]
MSEPARTFDVVVELFSYVFMVIGNLHIEEDAELDFSRYPTVGFCPGSICIGGPSPEDSETIKATFTIADSYSEWDDSFATHTIHVDEEGITIVDAVETSIDGPQDHVDYSYRLPWTGWTTLQFRAPDGFYTYEENLKTPRSLEVLVTPAPDHKPSVVKL